HDRPTRISPDDLRDYRAFSHAGQRTAKLGPKTRELIALAVAVTRQCDGSINCAHRGGDQQSHASREVYDCGPSNTQQPCGSRAVVARNVMLPHDRSCSTDSRSTLPAGEPADSAEGRWRLTCTALTCVELGEDEDLVAR